MRAAWPLAALLAGLGFAHAQEATYTNPVIAPVAADPSVVRAADGMFYLFATQDRWPDGLEHYLPIFRSADLVHWSFVADAQSGPPSWKRGGGFLWAPDVARVGDGYRLYYAASTWGDEDPCIGLATAKEPAGPWTDLGRPVLCSSSIGVANSIDPFVWYGDDGAATLIWGSFHGIWAVRLSEDGSQPVGDPVPLADRRFEAPYVIRRDGAYYLFVSSGSCCDGALSTYTTWVGRSDALLGPYLDRNGTDLRYGGGEVVLYRNDAWVGPGHNAVATDDAGVDWIVYHAIDPNDPTLPSGATRRPTLIDPIDWVDGWPVVRGGDGPSSGPHPAPVLHGR